MKARENPFRRERLESLAYRAPAFDWARLEARLERIGRRGAIVGPKGHGKTTLLEQWAARHRGSIHFRIREGQRKLDDAQRERLRASAGGWVLVDSAEQLGWFGWLDLRRRISRSDRLVIAAHRPGRLPTLFRCRTSPRLLAELVHELTGRTVDSESLWRRHAGNLREALRELYDAAYQIPSPKSALSA